jgi:hypothetical protein
MRSLLLFAEHGDADSVTLHINEYTELKIYDRILGVTIERKTLFDHAPNFACISQDILKMSSESF